MIETGPSGREMLGDERGWLRRACRWYGSARGRATFALAATAAVFGNFAVIELVHGLTEEPPASWRLTAPSRVAVIEAHPDDAILQAGGLVIQNSRLGGENLIVTVTADADSTVARAREREGRQAWSLLDAPPEILSLHFPSRRVWPPDAAESARDSIREILSRFDPDIVVTHLEEGGHPEHDLLARLGATVAEEMGDVQLLSASTYNPYYDPVQAPRKLYNFLIRLAPGIPYVDPTYGLPGSGRQRLEMTNEEMELKRDVILAYESQSEVIPLSQFGYPDFFQETGETTGYVPLAGKMFTAWGALSLALVFLFFAVMGFVVAGSLPHHRWMGAAAIAAMTASMALGLAGSPRILVEDLAYILLLLAGVAAGALVREVCARSRAESPGDPRI